MQVTFTWILDLVSEYPNLLTVCLSSDPLTGPKWSSIHQTNIAVHLFNHVSAQSYSLCRQIYTSFIVLAISTQCFHGYVTSGPPPAWLADAVPSAGFQSASSIVVAETWTTLWAQGTNTQLEKLELCEWVGWSHGWPSGCEIGFNQYTFLKVGDDSFVLELWE